MSHEGGPGHSSGACNSFPLPPATSLCSWRGNPAVEASTPYLAVDLSDPCRLCSLSGLGKPAVSSFQLCSNSWPFILMCLPGLGQHLSIVQYPTDFSYQARYLFLTPFNLLYQCAVTQVWRKIMTGKPRARFFLFCPLFPQAA